MRSVTCSKTKTLSRSGCYSCHASRTISDHVYANLAMYLPSQDSGFDIGMRLKSAPQVSRVRFVPENAAYIDAETGDYVIPAVCLHYCRKESFVQ